MVYPNPATTRINLKGIQDIDEVWLFNSMGILISQYKNVGKEELEIQVGNFADGLYFVTVKSPDGRTESLPFLKK